MTQFFDGFVLQGPRVSPSNASSTSAPESGVSRSVRPLPSGYPSGGPTWVEGRAEEYRTVLASPVGEAEYLIWAANTSRLAVLEDSSWAINDGSISIPAGSLTVNDPSTATGTRTDGSARVVLTDSQGRSMAGLVSLGFRRGGTPTTVSFVVGVDVTFDPVSGIITLLDTTTVRTATNVPVGKDVAASSLRGDTFTATYYLAGARFWWTRNDGLRTRFSWNGATNRWEPLKGEAPVNLGKISSAATQPYVLSPLPTGIPNGTCLPGSTGDAFATLRLGTQPDSSSYPIVERTSGSFSGVRVVPDDQVDPGYNFGVTSPALAGVVGSTSGVIAWNPAFLQDQDGLTLWYQPSNFKESGTGVVGKVTDGSLFLSPVPGPGERPIIRIGNRQPLTVMPVNSETTLAATTVPSGSVAFALSTGKLKLNPQDVARSNPGTRVSPNASFNPLYLDAEVIYDGITLNLYPQPPKAPCALVDSAGATGVYTGSDIFIPDAVDFPGTGISGILQVPDGIGNPPDSTASVGPRPGPSGLVRRLSAGYGDSILFTRQGAVATIVTVDFEDELPTDPYALPAGTAYVALQKHSPGSGSKVVFGADVASMFLGQTVYFRQGEFLPSVYMPNVSLVSRVRDTFILDGTESLRIRRDVTDVTWLASSLGAGTHTATAVAASITTAIGAGPGTCTVQGGHLVLHGTTRVAIGFGSTGEINTSGCKALGFVPGWMVTAPGDRSATDPCWQADAGFGLGIHRTALNIDGSQGVPDFRDTYHLDGQTITESIQANPFLFLDQAPREDIAGYDLGVFFLLSAQGLPGASPVVRAPLRPFKDVVYRFNQKQFGWITPTSFVAEVHAPLSAIDLGVAAPVDSSLLASMGGVLKISQGGSYQYLDLGTDVLVEGQSAHLINTIEPSVLAGSRGRFTLGSTTFTDSGTNFAATAAPGDRLEIPMGPSVGSYRVETVGSSTLTVSPALPEGDGGVNIPWVLYRGVTPGAIDPSVIADVTYQEFSHLPAEPFVVRILTRLGTAGGSINPAVAAEAIASGRDISIRFSPDGTDIPVTILNPRILGVMAQGTLSVPHIGADAPWLTSGAFSITVGTTNFVQAVGLIPVSSFSSDPGATIEYKTSDGALKFGSTVLQNLEGASVTWVPTVLPAAVIPTGTAQVVPSSGLVGLSQVDLTAKAGMSVYWVEQMIPNTDVTLNPVLGAFTFAQPLRAGQLVETEYTRAVDGTGAKLLTDGVPDVVKEFLPSFIRREVAVAQSPQVYTFNSAERTADPTVSPQVMAGSYMATYGVPPDATVDFVVNTITFTNPPAPGTRVTISYAVLEALGGESTYDVSSPPVWRPPFYIPAGATSFTLTTDRRGDLTLGKMLRLGSFLTYITGTSYNATTNVTTVTIAPSPTSGVGNLAPGEAPLCLITDRPVSLPGSAVGVEYRGFMPTMASAYGLSVFPHFDPLTPGQTEMRFDGDITRYAVVGHILEVNGNPFLIAKSDLSESNRQTIITLGSPYPGSLTWTGAQPASLIRISVRPVYPQGADSFLGAGKFLDSRPFEVVLFEWILPGVTLKQGEDYTVDTGTGKISFIKPRRQGLKPGSILKFSRTDTVVLRPFFSNGMVQYPRVSASFSYLDAPSSSNGKIGGSILGKYTFESPDSFYTRMVSFNTYAGDVGADITKSSVATSPSSGPVTLTVIRGNSFRGRTGIGAERQDLVSRDRVARAFFSYYNQVTGSFEQILETLDGNPVGDRDGKFRSWIGRGNPWVPPGYEDSITGAINPRVVWFNVWMGARGASTPIRILTSDPVISPLGATTDGSNRPVGNFQDPAGFASLLESQRQGVRNDVDDIVLVGRNRITRSLSGFITFTVTGYGDYRPLWQPSGFSRVYPERTTAFTTTGPGLGADPTTGDPGSYSAGRLTVNLTGPDSPSVDYQSTSGKDIGRLENPVLGVITNVLGMQARDRLARARVWGYSAVGYTSIDAGSANRPTIVASIVPLDRFPVTSGLPDPSQLASQSGGPTPTGLPDLATGDPALHTPPFKAGDQLALGTTGGSVKAIGYTGSIVVVNGVSRFAGVYVDSVLMGCLLTLKSKDEDGNDIPITLGSTLVVTTGNTSGTPFIPENGNTILVIPPSGESFATSDPPTTAELQQLARGIPNYRTGTDINYDARTGTLLDATLPSFSDPTFFGLKEITGQRPPAPLSTLEAQVAFQNGAVTPLTIPALQGLRTLDSGDYSVPYLTLPGAELPLLGDVSPKGIEMVYADSPSSVPTAPSTVDSYHLEALYPDEIRDDAVLVTGMNPAAMAALVTTANLHPASSVYPSPGHRGVGDLNPYDIVLIQNATGSAPVGSTGIFTVGSVTHGTPSIIEPPRFVSSTNAATATDFDIQNVQAILVPGHAAGMVVTEDTNVPGSVATYFDLVGISTSEVVFDNGTGGGGLATPIGGFNDFMVGAAAGTSVTLQVLNGSGAVVPTSTVIITLVTPGADILDAVFLVSGDNGSTYVPVDPGGLIFHAQQVEIRTADPFFIFTPYSPTSPGAGLTQTGGFHDALVSMTGVESTTVLIEADRLTFSTPVDCRSARARGTLAAPSTGAAAECRLSVVRHTASVYSSDTLDFTPVMVNFNSNTNLNGGSPYTFLARSTVAPSPYGIGAFGSGRGRLKVMAWEGYSNTPISGSDMVMSALPSARQDASGSILNAVAVADIVLASPTEPASGSNIFRPTTVLMGAPSNVRPGDILVVRQLRDDPMSTDATGTGKAGTYLLRGAVTANFGTSSRRAVLTTTAGDPNGWMQASFPTVVSTNVGGTVDLTVDDIPTLPPTKNFAGTTTTNTRTFPPSGRVFLILNEASLSSTDSVAYAKAIISAAYASISGNTFVNLTDFRDGVGSVSSQIQFLAGAASGVRVSGMTFLPVAVVTDGIPAGFSGYTDSAASVPSRCFFGFREVTGSRAATSKTYQASSNGDLASTPPGTTLSIYQRVNVPSTTMTAATDPVYDHIPGVLNITSFAWDAIHTTGVFTPAGSRCLLPGDIFSVNYSAAAGLYVEPSFPHASNNLSANRVNVVDALHGLTSGEIGARRLTDYLVNPSDIPVGGSLTEYVQCEVRRVRRWQSISTDLAHVLQRLRLTYEIRRGIVSSVVTTSGFSVLTATPVSAQRFPVAAGGGKATQLGNFTDPGLNVRPGDLVRFLDTTGRVLEEAEVQSIRGALSIALSRGNITVASSTRFEIHLRSPLVPQEQSAEELLALATDQVLIDRRANYTTQQGGTVTYVANADPQVAYDQSVNKLTDTSGAIFSNVRSGDMVIVDPAYALSGPTGLASPPEYGRRPQGDNGIVTRGSDYTAGGPARADDNRGYYRVASVTASEVTVSAVGNLLAGDRGSLPDVVFGGSNGYAVYPTVHGSNLSGTGNGREGQMDLRPTGLAGVGNSYTGTWLSVAPFSYRVIRPSSFLSKETVELILANRERIITWMDMIAGAFMVNHGGSYAVFQAETHLRFLGLASDPDTGTGILRNGLVESIIGRVMVAPFANNTGCISALDRRFWGLDLRLDTQTPPYGPSTFYSDFQHGTGRPVLPDRIATVLNQRDQIRQTRNSWLSIRVNRSTGTLERIRQFDLEAPARKAEQERVLRATRSTEKKP